MVEKSILIIDDEKEIGILLEAVIDPSVISITHVGNGIEGLRYLEENTPNLILLDIQLPELNGMEILQSIRNKGREIRVVMVTAFASVESAVNALKSGADDYLCKPFSIEELHNKINQYLEMPHNHCEKRPASLEEVEKKHISSVLAQNDGNRRKTADDLGISLRTLYYKIKQYDLV